MLGIEKGAFDDDVGGRVRHARFLAAHDAADVMDMGIIGDDRHRLVERVGLAVEGKDRLARLRLARDEAAGELRLVIDVQRPAEIDGDVIGDVDQGRDRLLTDRAQPLRQPFRRCAVGDAVDALREEGRAAGGVVGAHVRARAFASNRLRGQRLQRAEAGGGEIAGDAAHAHAILPVGGDRHVDDRIVEARPFGIDLTDRRIGGQFDDAVMIVAQFQLTRGAHHAVRFDAADRRDLQHHAVRRHGCPGHAEHADEAGTRVGRAAHNLERAPSVHIGTGIDRQHLELVRLRMPLGSQHLCDAEGGELLARVLDPFDLEADAREPDEDLVQRG